MGKANNSSRLTDYAQVWAQAIKRLDYSARSRQEIHKYLADKGAVADDIIAVCDRLEQLGIIDDLSYGRGLAQYKLHIRKWSEAQTSAFLRHRGISNDLIQIIFTDISAEQETENAIFLVRKVMPRYIKYQGADRQWRIEQMLRRKGFNPSNFRSRLVDLLNETNN